MGQIDDQIEHRSGSLCAGSLRVISAFELAIDERIRRVIAEARLDEFYLRLAYRLLAREGKRARSEARLLVSDRVVGIILYRLARSLARRRKNVSEAELERFVSRKQAQHLVRQNRYRFEISPPEGIEIISVSAEPELVPA